MSRISNVGNVKVNRFTNSDIHKKINIEKLDFESHST